MYRFCYRTLCSPGTAHVASNPWNKRPWTARYQSRFYVVSKIDGIFVLLGRLAGSQRKRYIVLNSNARVRLTPQKSALCDAVDDDEPDKRFR